MLRNSIISQANHIHQLGGGFASLLSSHFRNGAEGGSRQRIEGPTDTAIFTSSPIGDFSIVFWYEMDELMAQFHGPVGSATNSSFQNGWGIYRDSTDSEARIYIDAFNTSFHQFTHTDMWTVNGWHCLAFAFDATDRSVTAWVDGTQYAGVTDDISATRDLGGAHSFGCSDTAGGTSTDFPGKIDTSAFWEGVIMNNTQAVALYNSGVPVLPSSVIASPTWELIHGDDPSDDAAIGTGQVTDQSGNGNHFTPEAADNIPAFEFIADVP